MNLEDFRRHAHDFVDWMADYLRDIEKYPIRSPLNPGEILKQIPAKAPENGESMDVVFNDFKEVVLPGITHWQHPRFFAYFPANSSPPSVLAEMLISTLANQCMIWETSPAANELETRMMEWLRSMLHLPAQFRGTIQDSASTATLCALLAARERALGFSGIENGLFQNQKLTVYASKDVHSSIDKAVKVAGFGLDHLRKVKVDQHRRLDPEDLQRRISEDRSKGLKPACVVACFGTTGVGALDPLDEIAEICKREEVFLHVDAAWAGSALILDENRHYIRSADLFDSFVFDPHKWLFTNFDCAAHFLKDPSELERTLTVLPSYLKSAQTGKVPEYRDWTIPLGRRFRALKLWFVLRSYGTKQLKELLRKHISLLSHFSKYLEGSEQWEIVTPPSFGLLTFRLKPREDECGQDVNRRNEELLHKVNSDGRIYLTQTMIEDQFVIRFSVGQTYTEKRHVDEAWQVLQEIEKGS